MTEPGKRAAPSLSPQTPGRPRLSTDPAAGGTRAAGRGILSTMPRRPRPLPAQLGAAFGVADARTTGATRARLRAKDLARPHRGVRVRNATAPASVDTDPLARDRRVRAAVLARVQAFEVIRRPHVFYTGRTAVAIFDRLFDDDDGTGPLQVGVFAPARAPRVAGIRATQTSPGLVTVGAIGALPVASPASVWAGLAGELSVRDLVRLGDALVRIPRGAGGMPQPQAQLATIAQLRAAAEAPRRKERRKLRAALALIRVGSMSPLETDFRVDAVEAGLPEPELDVEMRAADGRLIGIVDLVFRAYRVIVEVEGRHHRSSDQQWERDIDKYAALAAEGWDVIRVTGRRVRGGRAVSQVAAALRRRGWAG